MTTEEILDELKRIEDSFEGDEEAFGYKNPETLIAELIRDIKRDKYLGIAS